MAQRNRALETLQLFRYDPDGQLLSELNPDLHGRTVDTGIVALDCEMVGVGPANKSTLGRVSIVNVHGYCLYDKFVKPNRPVTNYRTRFSGIRKPNLRDATPHNTVVEEVRTLLKGHVLVGHSLLHDFSVLGYNHPKKKTRDTSVFYKALLEDSKTPGLKMLAKKYLSVDIQKGPHSSITDAQAAMALYLLKRQEWEAQLGHVAVGHEDSSACGSQVNPVSNNPFTANFDFEINTDAEAAVVLYLLKLDEGEAKLGNNAGGLVGDASVFGFQVNPVAKNPFANFDFDRDGSLVTQASSVEDEMVESTRVVSVAWKVVKVHGERDALGWISIVNEYGYRLYNTFVKPSKQITCCNTDETGIREEDLATATPQGVVMRVVHGLLKRHIVVSHNFEVLSMFGLSVSKKNQRDIEKYTCELGYASYPGLAELAKKVFGININYKGGPSCVNDAQVLMGIYQRYREGWELFIQGRPGK